MIAASLHAISEDDNHPTSPSAGSLSDGPVRTQSPAQSTGESESASVSGAPGSHPQIDLSTLLEKLWPAVGQAASLSDDDSSSQHPELTEIDLSPGNDRDENENDRGPTAEDTAGGKIDALLPQFGTYWRALNDFLGDSELGEPGAVDAALERLFGPQDSEHRGAGRSGASSKRSARSSGSTAAETRRSVIPEKSKGLPEPLVSLAVKRKAGDEAATAHTIVPPENGGAAPLHPENQIAPSETKQSTKSSSVSLSSVNQNTTTVTDAEETGSDSMTDSSVEQQKEHRGRPGSTWSHRHRPAQAFSALKQQLPGLSDALNNGTLSRMLAGRLNAAARNSSRGAFSSASSIRTLGRLLASRRAATGRNNNNDSVVNNKNNTNGNSGRNSSSSAGNNKSKSSSGSRRLFNFKTLGRLLASRRAAAAVGRSSSSGGGSSAALNGTSSSTGHSLHNQPASSAVNGTAEGETDGSTDRRPGRRPGRLPHRFPGRLGSPAAPANDSRPTPGHEDDSKMDAWTTSASSLLVSLLTPGRLADTVSEAVGRASSRLADSLLGRLTGPLQTVTGRASSRLSRLPRLLAPAERLVMGDLADPVRPAPDEYYARRPRSEMERLQRRLGYAESAERAEAAELARLRRRLKEQRLAGRAHWSVQAAERNGDLMAHLWTLQP